MERWVGALEFFFSIFFCHDEGRPRKKYIHLAVQAYDDPMTRFYG